MPKVPYEVFEGVVFSEGLADELESKAEPGEHGAQRDEFTLRTAPFGFSVARLPEESDDLRCVGQVDIDPIHGKKAKPVLPQQGRGKRSFEPVLKVFPHVSPEPDRKLFSGLAEGFLADTVFIQPWASDAYQSPCSAESLRHGGRLQPHVHHQPRDNFGNERTLPSGRTMAFACCFLKNLRRKDVAKRRQTELLENG